MKKEIWIGKKSLRFFYYRYKDSPYYPLSIVLFTILICILLIFNVVIPQVKNWFSIREEVIATQGRIKILRENIDFMRNVDRSVLDSQLQTASMAVPPEKDFGAVLNALKDASTLSGVSLQDFSFQVGSISAALGQPANVPEQDLSTITLSVVISGDLEGVKRFMRELGNKVPVSEVTTVDGKIESLSVNIQFYQKKLPEIELDNKKPIVRISEEKKALLQKLSSWKPAQQLPDFSAVTASGPAEMPLF